MPHPPSASCQHFLPEKKITCGHAALFSHELTPNIYPQLEKGITGVKEHGRKHTNVY